MSCAKCETSLKAGVKYVDSADKGKHCVPCYEELFSNECVECGEKIGVGHKDLTYGEQHYHSECFKCCMCDTQLGKDFTSKDGARYCDACLEEKFGPDAGKCRECREKFKPGQKKMMYGEEEFHEQCFKCYSCDKPIAGGRFFIRPDGKMCQGCKESDAAAAESQ